MKILDHIIREFAIDISERITRKTIYSLQKIESNMFGDDSGLKNAWDEICVQIQQELTLVWDVYVETVESIIADFVRKLKEHEKVALWLQTPQGWDWQWEIDEEHTEEEPPIMEEDIVQYIANEYVFVKAGSWSNKRIWNLLYNQSF